MKYEQKIKEKTVIVPKWMSENIPTIRTIMELGGISKLNKKDIVGITEYLYSWHIRIKTKKQVKK